MKYGLSEPQLKEITTIIASYDAVEEAILFGSRAIDTFKEASDVDIAIKGKNADWSLALTLKDHLEEETYLPFFFDVVAYGRIESKELKRHIDGKGKSLFCRGMSEWGECKLDDFAKINPTERLPKGTLAKKIPMEALQPFTKKIPFCLHEGYNGGVKFRNGDTVMARITPSLENGKTSYVDILDDDEIGSGSTEFIVLREREDISDKHFLYYLAISSEIRDIAILSMTGSSGRQRVQTDVVKDHELFVPPLPEQKAIAEVLSALDDKIDLLHRQNKTLEQMAETLFRQWFVEETQKDWEEGVLSDLVDIKYGKGHKKLSDGNIPVYGSGGIMRYAEKALYENESVLIPRKGTLNNVTYVNEPFWSIDTIFYTVMKKPNLAKFIYHFVKEKDLASMNVGSAVPSMTTQVLNNMALKIPFDKDLEYFEDIVTPSYQKLKTNKTQIRTLESIRDTLLPKLMSGNIRVKWDRETSIQ